jgi:hypothetical protein
MKVNLKNPLWKMDPQKAKEGFEKELREIREHSAHRQNLGDLALITIKEILGE